MECGMHCFYGDFVFNFISDMNRLDDLVHMALSMEFVFQTEAARKRWQKRESFEMTRASVRAVM